MTTRSTLFALCAATALLGACSKYTEQTSPCFGKIGEAVVSRASLSFAATGSPSKDCTFEELRRPE